MPNIAIYEGGKAARMNGVSRITTDDGNDGKITWVPQSERQTGTLYVSENGTYRAEDEGLHSWSKVTVRLAGAPLGLEVPTLPDPVTGAEIPTGEEGELEPVAPAGLEPIEDEPISADEAESILEDTEFDPSDLDPDSPNYDDAMEAIADALGVDPEDVKVIDPEKKEDVKKEQPKVEDKGQKAVGTDTDTGKDATITPSGKTSEAVPKAIAVTRPPRKTSYHDGDTIDFSGIEVRLFISYEEDGTTVNAKPYKDGRYPDGTIPFGELVFPETVAHANGERRTAISELLDREITVHNHFEIYGRAVNSGWNQLYLYWKWITCNEQFFVIKTDTRQNGWNPSIQVVFASATEGSTAGWSIRNKFERHKTLEADSPIVEESDVMSFDSVSLQSSYTYAGKTVYYASKSIGIELFPFVEGSISPVEDNSDMSSVASLVAWTMVYGDTVGTMDVPVEWVSPYDGKTYSDTFQIEISD